MGIQRFLLRLLPVGIRARSVEATFAILGILLVVLAATGVTGTRVLQTFPWWGVALWEMCLFVGCVAWLVGILSAKRQDSLPDAVLITRIPVYAFGLTLVSGASAMLAIAIVAFAGVRYGLTSVVWFMLAIGTFVRRADLVDRTKGE